MSALKRETIDYRPLRKPDAKFTRLIRNDLYWTPAQHIEILHRGDVKRASDKIIFLGYKNRYIEPEVGDYVGLLHAVFDLKDAQPKGEIGVKRNAGRDWQHFLFPTLQEIGTSKFTDQVNQLIGEKDVYFSQQSFLRKPGTRREKNISRLGAFYADIDKVREKFGLTAAEAAALVIQICEEQALPGPSFITETGRGVHAVWQFSHVSHGRLTHWQHTQRKLKTALAELEPDTATDSPRMLRLCGTVNARPGANEAVCRPIYVKGEHPLFPHRYSFEHLWLTIAPPPPRNKVWKKKKQAEIFSITDASGTMRPSQDKNSPARWASFYTLVLEDLRKVVKYNWPDGIVPETHRNNTLLAISMCLAHAVHPLALNKMIRKEMERMGWKDHRAISYMSSVHSRAQELMNNGKWVFPAIKGAEGDPRYTPGAKWFIERFGITRDMMTELNLRALICKDRKRENDRIRQAASRGQEVLPLDRQGRDRVNRKRVLMSGREIAAYLNDTKGASIRTAAAEFDLPKSTVHRHLQAYQEASDSEISQLSQPVPRDSLPQGGSINMESNIDKESTYIDNCRAGGARRPQVEHFENRVEDVALAEDEAGTGNSAQIYPSDIKKQESWVSDSMGLVANNNRSPKDHAELLPSVDTNALDVFGFEIIGAQTCQSEYYRCPQHLHERLISAAGEMVSPEDTSLSINDTKTLPVAPEEVYEKAREWLERETGELDIPYGWCDYALAV